MVHNTNAKYFVDTLTFEQVGNLAWEIGEKSVTSWVQEFNRFSQEHAQEINKALDDFSVLYGVNKPDKAIVVDLHHNPIEGNTNGGPRSNYEGLENSFPIINKMGDFMYRLPQYEGDSASLVSEQTVKLLHEAQHTFFQDKNFNTLVESTVATPQVAKKLSTIFSQGVLLFAIMRMNLLNL